MMTAAPALREIIQIEKRFKFAPFLDAYVSQKHENDHFNFS